MFFLVEKDDQDRRVLAVEEWDLQDAERRAARTFSLEPHLPFVVGDQEAGKVAADHHAFLMFGRTLANVSNIAGKIVANNIGVAI